MFVFFFFNDTATTEIYTLSLHDALPISAGLLTALNDDFTLSGQSPGAPLRLTTVVTATFDRSEEHTSELQSLAYLVCRLLLEKKKKMARMSLRCAGSVSDRIGVDRDHAP